MKILLDTHILLWAAANTLPPLASKHVLNDSNDLFFSPASIWEVVIKQGLNRNDFAADPHLLYSALVDNGFEELHITSEHTLLTGTLPMIHKDPFDRILIAQSIAEGISLLTSDDIIANYPAPVILVS